MEQMEQAGTRGGNTITPRVLSHSKSKKRRYAFTLNNYTDDDWNKLPINFKDALYIFGKEVGESGTPHIQGYIEYANPRSFEKIKDLLPKAHIESAKGDRKSNYLYCSKDGDFITNITGIKQPEKIYDPMEELSPLPWQKNILNIIENDCKDRTIHWYWEETGGAGKTTLCKHLCLKYNCIVVNGKQNDMFNAILQYKATNECYPKVVLIDIPRSSINYVSWGAIEKIKDGLFYSGKYEGGMVIMNTPHVICFANSEPDEEKLSLDRWRIININEFVDDEYEVELIDI